MRLTLDLDGFDQASRRIGLNAARRAEALLQIRPARVIVRADRADWPLGSEAWPGGAVAPAEMRDLPR
ncbi:MAG TPA: hypothetical protein VHD15_14975 [Hyphomicrobiales bacterium]|nr:hypothetical protein [Hyphomicrobiales bacterium]